jgi:hypothetical protein
MELVGKTEIKIYNGERKKKSKLMKLGVCGREPAFPGYSVLVGM